MIKHEELMQQTILNKEGFLFAIDNRHPKFPHAICATDSLNPEYINLMAAAGLLYRVSGETIAFFEPLIEYLEEKGMTEAVPSVAAIQATLHSAMKLAIEGFAKKAQDDDKTA